MEMIGICKIVEMDRNRCVVIQLWAILRKSRQRLTSLWKSILALWEGGSNMHVYTHLFAHSSFSHLFLQQMLVRCPLFCKSLC